MILEVSVFAQMTEKEKVLITTPIYYINDVPHIGHTYTTVAADILARWHRLKGRDVFFLTGLDENSVKTVQAAEKRGLDIQTYADEMSVIWKETWKTLNISNDDFIRTTEDRHKRNVNNFFLRVNEKDDIYKGKYEGLYCEGCEAFLTESDLVDGMCPLHKKEPKAVKEENYFFKLSKYQDKILNHIKENPDFIQPATRKNEVVSFVKSGLKDISISRPGLEWGIVLPIDNKHRFWVWFDALLNYLIDKSYWPASVHLIAKDILRFHAVIWPGMLLSAGYKLPTKIFAHGFLTIDGQKISKSLGNAIDPLFLADRYSVDALRYFLFRDISFGEDGDFSETALQARLNNELVANVGNFIYRVLSFLRTNFGSVVPEPNALGKVDKDLIEKMSNAKQSVEAAIENYKLHEALHAVVELSKEGNRYFQKKKPWKTLKKKPEDCIATMYIAVNLVRALAILFAPFMPSTCERLWGQLNLDGSVFEQDFDDLDKLHISPGHRIGQIEPLFKKFEI